MFYPFGGCETQPLITVANITLRNVQQYHTILPPGIVRGNETHPTTGIVFDNVNASGWWKWLGLGYITESVYGTATNSDPYPKFKGGLPGDLDSLEVDEPFDVTRFFVGHAQKIIDFCVLQVMNNFPTFTMEEFPTLRQLVRGVQGAYDVVRF